MVNNPLVLVVGAGASFPYGFPLGSQLRTEICNIENDDSLLRASLVKHINLDDSLLRNFAKSFRLSSVKSIDAFLAKRSEFESIGKLAIAASLISKSTKKTKEYDLEDNWYLELWNLLISGINSHNELKNNKLRIITFNYDYSLESFIHSSIVHTFGVSDTDAFSVLKNIPILHVYGSIRSLDSSNTLTDEPVFNAESLKYGAKNIKVIPESRDDDEVFVNARTWFDWAKNIFFLGFGFDELNINRLDLKTVLDYKTRNDMAHPRVFASVFGMTNNEIELARARLGVIRNWNALPHKNIIALREQIELFT